MTEAARTAPQPTEGARPAPCPEVRTTLDHAWGGLRVLEIQADPREVPAQALATTAVSLNVGSPFSCESSFDGARMELHHTPHHGVSLYPANARFRGRSLGPTSQVVVELSPGFLSVAGAAAPGAPPLR